MRARRASRGDDRADRAAQRLARHDPDLLPAVAVAAGAGAEQRRAASAGPEQPLALTLDDIDQDLREPAGEVQQVGGVELERLRDGAGEDGGGPLGPGDRILRADHVALAHPELDLATAGGRARGPVHQAGGDQPDPVTRLARGAQLLAGGELTRPHLGNNGFELRRRQPLEQATSGKRRLARHLNRPSRHWTAAYGRGSGHVKRRDLTVGRPTWL